MTGFVRYSTAEGGDILLHVLTYGTGLLHTYGTGLFHALHHAAHLFHR